jgi:hypothetical protein
MTETRLVAPSTRGLAAEARWERAFPLTLERADTRSGIRFVL